MALRVIRLNPCPAPEANDPAPHLPPAVPSRLSPFMPVRGFTKILLAGWTGLCLGSIGWAADAAPGNTAVGGGHAAPAPTAPNAPPAAERQPRTDRGAVPPPTDPAVGLPMAIPGSNRDPQPPAPQTLSDTPAPRLLTTDPDTDRLARKLIADLDSPASEIAHRAFRQLVALDGGAVATINGELLTQQRLRQRGSLNLQYRLREALQTIALQIPDSYRQRLMEERRQAAAARIRIVRQVLGRTTTPHPTPEEIRLQDIPSRLDDTQFAAILRLPGDWPARFLEKFLLAGGLAVTPDPDLTSAEAAVDPRQQFILQQQAMQQDGESSGNAFLDTLLQAPAAALRRIDGEFYLQWQALMKQLYPNPEIQNAVIAVTRQGLIGRIDPATLDWAAATVRGALGETLTGDDAAAEPEDDVLGTAGSVGLAIEMLGEGARPADVQLLRDLAFRADTPWRVHALQALRLFWTEADLPRLVQLVRDANRVRDYGAIVDTALALEHPQLDAAVARRADWFNSDNLQWQIMRYVLQRGTPELVDAALKAWTHEDSLNDHAQTLAVVFRRKECYPAILRSIYSPTNERLGYDTTLSSAYSLLQQDPELVKPWLYALSDLLGAGRKEYAETPRYGKPLFDQLRETFKDETNVNTLYARARIVAEVRLLLAIAGDADIRQSVAKALQTPINQAGMRRMDFEQVLLMWYCRLLPQYPLPDLQTYLGKVDQRYYGGRAEDTRQVFEPNQVRMELAGRFGENQAFWYNRRRAFRRSSNRNWQDQVEAAGLLPPPPLNYSHEPRLQAALQYHVPELIGEILRDHAEEFAGDDGSRMSGASVLGEICAYQQATALYEAFLTDLAGRPPRVVMLNGERESLYSVCNNLSWLYATALDPAWCKTDRAVRLAEQSVRLEPGMSFNIDTRAYAYLAAGRYAEALADFEASARLLGVNDPAGLASSLARQARALHGLSRDTEALHRLQQADNLRPSDGDTLFWIARGYGLLGRHDLALQRLAQAEAAGFMYHEQLILCRDFDGIRDQRLYRNVLDNMQRHRKLIREIVQEYTPVSAIPAEIDAEETTPSAAAQDEFEMRMFSR